MEMKDKIAILNGMKNIERLQGTPHHRGYNLLEHGFSVAMMFKWFASVEDVSYTHDIFVKILMHDALESLTGDLIQPVKKFNQKTSDAWDLIESELSKTNTTLSFLTDHELRLSMTEIQHRLFKICDYLDLWIFCVNEKALGNNSVKMDKCLNNCLSLILDKTENFKYFKSVKKFIDDYEG